MTDTLEYEFDEIRLSGEGLMAWGTATLESAGDGYPGEFFVSRVKLYKGETFDRKNLVKGSPQSWIFNRIAADIESSEHAQSEWADFEQGLTQPDPDRLHDERRDMRVLAYLDAGRIVDGANING